MALYDNKMWLLSHIRNSFILTDDTGMCELVMVGEDFPKTLSKKQKDNVMSPIEESSSDDDELAQNESYDIHIDMDIGIRYRSNTAQKLEKLDLQQKRAAKIKHIKWEPNTQPLTEEEKNALFTKRDYKSETVNTKSLLTQQLKCYINQPQNPYLEYAKFDGNAQVGIPVRKYKIYLTMLPEEQRNYPMNVCVIATAKVQDLIGLICLKCSTIHGDYPLQPVSHYGLYITEEDGEVDRDFPCLDAREGVAKFGFTCLGLVEHKFTNNQNPNNQSGSNISHVPKNVSFEDNPINLDQDEQGPSTSQNLMRDFASVEDKENKKLMESHTSAMEAPLYKSYKVWLIHKVRARTYIQLAVSGDKLEIDPLGASGLPWPRLAKPVSHHMESIASCEILETRSKAKAVFKIVYIPPGVDTSFKHYDFECDLVTAEEIVQKINLILEIRSSTSRKEYLAHKDKKIISKKGFHISVRS